MSKKAAAAVGVVAAFFGGAWLISKAAAKANTYKVRIASTPVRTVLLVDGKALVETPAIIELMPGIHTLKAVLKSPDLLVTYGFDRWTVNGREAGFNNTLTFNVSGPTVVQANFRMIEYGIYPIMTV